MLLFPQSRQSVIEHLIGTAEMAASDFFLYNPLLFGFELNGHCFTVTRPIGDVNAIIPRVQAATT